MQSKSTNDHKSPVRLAHVNGFVEKFTFIKAAYRDGIFVDVQRTLHVILN